ncbi:hypothetical protein [Mangrovactinospora gilvigrisea]|nr:hypothetical protein [Mangrovactinospora gilvigrisea]
MRRIGVVIGMAIALAVGSVGTAHAGYSSTTTTTTTKSKKKVSQDGNDTNLTISYTDQSGAPVTTPGNATSTAPVDSDPPPCYYAPETPAQVKADMDPVWASGAIGSHWRYQEMQKFHVSGQKDDKTDYNADKADEGYWWVGTYNPDYTGTASCGIDMETPHWVKKGDTPPTPPAETINPTMLAKMAYARLHLPDTEVSLNPAGTSTVNLPTWAWLPPKQFHPVSVTARLNAPGINLSATATAKPVRLTIDPGTADAAVYPSSGGCPANANGSIGTRYRKGDATKTPPCGVSYQHASNDGPFTLRATVTWQIDTDVAGTQLPPATFGTARDVPVQEIQTVTSGGQ